LLLDHELPARPNPGQQRRAFHGTVAFETVTNHAEISTDDPDGTCPPHGPYGTG
jgi:hypothetical protein